MRSLRLLALAPVVVVASLAACEDSGGSTSGGGFGIDSGPGFEAGPQAEGGTPESGTPDVLQPEVAPKGVTVTVNKAAVAQKDVRVLAHDATGAVTGDVKTDAAGKVTFAAAPSMVTVLSVVFGAPAALTYLGVADGDTLVVEQGTFESEPPAVGSYAVTVTPPGFGANSYSLSVGGDGCGNFTTDVSTPVSVTLYPYCLGATNAVLVTTFGNSGINGFGFTKGVAKPAAGATGNVAVNNIAAPATATLTAPGIPVGPTEVELRSIANGFAYHTASGTGAFDAGGVQVPIASGFAEGYQSLVVVSQADVSPPTTKGFLRRELAPAAVNPTFLYDFSTALPYISNATLTGAVPRPDVTVTAAAGGTLASSDGGIVRVSWVVPGGISQNKQWSFVVPPGTTTFKLPALPADTDAAQYVPQAGATVADVLFVEASYLPGYAQLKALPMQATGSSDFASMSSKPLPTNGTVKITSRGLNIVPPG